MACLIWIAISGVGLAGASLIHALVKNPHLDVHIFESAAAFKESGAAVGIARNALAALDLIAPQPRTVSSVLVPVLSWVSALFHHQGTYSCESA